MIAEIVAVVDFASIISINHTANNVRAHKFANIININRFALCVVEEGYVKLMELSEVVV
jgi:hypothetical protein